MNFPILNIKSWLIDIGIVLLVAVLAIGSWEFSKYRAYKRGYAAATTAESLASAKTQIQQEKVTTRIITKYVPQVKIIREKGKTIIKKVPIYVTQKDNRAAPVNIGFVSLWNAANKMQFPNSPSTDNEKPSRVVLAEVAAEHIREVTICTETEKQRDALKEWILSEVAVSKK